MEHTLISHPRLHVREKTGSEGPSYDPYGFTELHVHTADNIDVVLHEGLAMYFLLNGLRTNIVGADYDNPKDIFDKVLLDVTGFTEAQLRRFHRKASSRCPEGGYHDTESVRGYPGESLEICCKCGKVVDSYFNEGAII